VSMPLPITLPINAASNDEFLLFVWIILFAPLGIYRICVKQTIYTNGWNGKYLDW
jgi:hypothetical protein